MERGKIVSLAVGLSLLTATSVVPPSHAFAATALLSTAATSTDETPHDFNLQVTPSPIVSTVQPGVQSSQDIKIFNNGTAAEDLKIEPRSFTFDSKTGKIHLDDTAPPSVADWISFGQSKFTIQAGQSFTNKIVLHVPKDAGFSYSFALVISRQNPPKAAGGTRQITGSLAVFMLVNVDRPGATSKLEVVQFASSKNLYEYLPATLDIRFKNTGNTIIQPYGNLFIQRGTNDKKPIAALTVNETKGYILPGTERTFSSDWSDGFAVYTNETGADGSLKRHLQVDWSKLSHFRIGRYTAHLVAVYSDGTHDVPIEGTVTFWVIPWRAILVLVAVVIGLWLLARWRGKKRTEKAVKRALAAQAAASKQAAKAEAADTKEEQS